MTPKARRHSRAWMAAEDEIIDLNPVRWRHLFSTEHDSGPQPLLYGIGCSMLLIFGIQQAIGVWLSFAAVAVILHFCIIGAGRGEWPRKLLSI